MRFRLRTLLILLAVGPPVLAAIWWVWPEFRRSWLLIGPWEALLVGLVLFILYGHRRPSLMRALGRRF